MDAKLLKSITSQVYRRFPEVAGSQPKVQLQTAPQSKSFPSGPTYLITFRSFAQATNGKSIPRVVRVIATPQGRILKITTSR